jgi:hypothetical protein
MEQFTYPNTLQSVAMMECPENSLVKPELLIKMESYNMLLYKVRGVEMEKL